jgi:ssDNA-binding Zn-finger/Zn-ribbon topoisomerase 1
MAKKKEIVICQYCGANGKLESSLRIYRQDYGYVWICENYPSCDAYVGCHENTKSPKGWMANEELRTYRKETHRLFDALWKEKIKRQKPKRSKERGKIRGDAYKWLATNLEIDVKYCHIAMFDIDMCKAAIEICEPYFEKLRSRIRDL